MGNLLEIATIRLTIGFIMRTTSSVVLNKELPLYIDFQKHAHTNQHAPRCGPTQFILFSIFNAAPIALGYYTFSERKTFRSLNTFYCLQIINLWSHDKMYFLMLTLLIFITCLIKN